MEEGEGEGGEGHQDPLFPSWQKKLSPFMWGVWARLCSPHPTPGLLKSQVRESLEEGQQWSFLEEPS